MSTHEIPRRLMKSALEFSLGIFLQFAENVTTRRLLMSISYGNLLFIVIMSMLWWHRILSLNISTDLGPEDIAIVQFDSRPLSNYWEAAARWNNLYAKKHGHVFLYYTLKGDCMYMTEKLASPWCKVKAMLQATNDNPDIRVFIYMDSDAVVDVSFQHLSLNEYLGQLQLKLKWKPPQKPLVFNQDGPCWWCNLIQRVGYTMCLNAGTVMWYAHPIGVKLLEDWWHSSMESYTNNPLKRKFRNNWPWEQDRQMALYNRSSENIQITSHPHLPMMPREPGSRRIADWCFSHLPGSGCFISHYCADQYSKKQMKKIYSELVSST
eukprot:gene5418-10844_t